MAPLRPRCTPPLRHPAQPNVAMATMLAAEGRGAQGDGGVRVGARAKRPRGFHRTTMAPRHRCALCPSPATAPPSRSLSTCAADRSGGARCRSRRGCSTTGGAPPFVPSSRLIVSNGAADRPPPRAAVSSTATPRRWLGAELPRRGPRSCSRQPAAGSLQPGVAGCGGAPPRRAPAMSPVGQRRAAAGRSAPGRCALRALPYPNPALALTAARAVLLSLTRRLCLRPDGAGNLGKRRARTAAKDARSRWTAAHWLGSLRHPAARPLALRANQAKTTGPCPDLPLNLLTGQSSGYGLPSWCWRCFPQPGAGGSSPLRRRTCPPCRQAPSSRGIWTNVLRALSSVTAALVLGNYSSKHAATLAGSDAV